MKYSELKKILTVPEKDEFEIQYEIPSGIALIVITEYPAVRTNKLVDRIDELLCEDPLDDPHNHHELIIQYTDDDIDSYDLDVDPDPELNIDLYKLITLEELKS